jgi:NAD(P)-dependent dehydrogenase (short-subunit alcohol dehydrogenase family)
MNRLQHKVALITGGTTGIGLETARLFLAEGAKVILTGKNPDTLAKVRAELPNAEVISSDAGSVSANEQLVAEVVKRHGRIDVLFINAGVGLFVPVEAIDEAAFDHVMNINFKGAFFLLRAALPHLSKGASVVANATVGTQSGLTNASVYSASKAALTVGLRTLIAEEGVQAKGIRINVIHPGPIVTPIYEKMGLPADVMAGFGAMLTARAPLKRMGSPEEVANLVLFLASDESSYMTGSEVLIDGGMNATLN